VQEQPRADPVIEEVDVAPVLTAQAALSGAEEVELTVILSYTDEDGDLASSCALRELQNLLETTACACNAGVCQVGVTGTPNFNGEASFEAQLTAGAATSEWVAQVVTITPMFRLTRAALFRILDSDYMELAEIKGLSRRRILVGQALPNAMGPIANAMVLSIINLFFGLVIVETIFSYPGLGLLMVTAVRVHDVPLAQGCALVSAVICIVLNFIADAVSILANPRLRTTSSASSTSPPGSTTPRSISNVPQKSCSTKRSLVVPAWPGGVYVVRSWACSICLYAM